MKMIKKVFKESIKSKQIVAKKIRTLVLQFTIIHKASLQRFFELQIVVNNMKNRAFEFHEQRIFFEEFMIKFYFFLMTQLILMQKHMFCIDSITNIKNKPQFKNLKVY